jgi:hypothetical protein
MSLIAKTPEPPYYTVIFTSLRTEDDYGYHRKAQKISREKRYSAFTTRICKVKQDYCSQCYDTGGLFETDRILECEEMNPDKVVRNKVQTLTDLPNIGKAMERDLHILGIITPSQLKGRSPYDLYYELCNKKGVKQDPCVLDVLISITRFMEGAEPLPWWKFTSERKAYIKKMKNTH